MTDTPAFITRLLALIASTALFAGMWAGDGPADGMALHHKTGVNSLVQREPEWVPIEEPITHRVAASAATVSPGLTLSVSGISKSLTVESDGLAIAPELLQRHVEQLPLGIAAGDYRIVDSQGGVGWLRVRSTSSANGPSDAMRLMTTSIDGAPVQFIRIVPAAIGAGNSGIKK
jgi:hypothetical protein